MNEDEVFAAVGEEGFARLVAAFYKQIPTDEILGPLYPADELMAAEERLRDFLIFPVRRVHALHRAARTPKAGDAARAISDHGRRSRPLAAVDG